MRKIISSIIIILFVVVVWQGFVFYSQINDPIRQSESEALRYLKENIDIDQIIVSDYYHGTESFHVFQIADQDGEEFIVWVPHSLDKYVVKQKNEGISIDEVKQFIERELNPKQLISIKLGMENSIPLYEIIYKDQQERLSYYFISFKTGTYLKHYHLGM
jgi:uncharacterized protein YpmB